MEETLRQVPNVWRSLIYLVAQVASCRFSCCFPAVMEQGTINIQVLGICFILPQSLLEREHRLWQLSVSAPRHSQRWVLRTVMKLLHKNSSLHEAGLWGTWEYHTNIYYRFFFLIENQTCFIRDDRAWFQNLTFIWIKVTVTKLEQRNISEFIPWSTATETHREAGRKEEGRGRRIGNSIILLTPQSPLP